MSESAGVNKKIGKILELQKKKFSMKSVPADVLVFYCLVIGPWLNGNRLTAILQCTSYIFADLRVNFAVS